MEHILIATCLRRYSAVLALDSLVAIHQFLPGEQYSGCVAELPQPPRCQSAECQPVRSIR
jgi:hypothetical protein